MTVVGLVLIVPFAITAYVVWIGDPAPDDALSIESPAKQAR